MLILNMITGFTQEELANFIGVSRASINNWLNDDDSMSDNSKKIICDKFQIPYNFFQVDLNQNLDYYKLVYSTILENWKRINNNYSEDNSNSKKINDILNQIDSDIKQVYYEKLDDIEIMEGLANGYNPFTGEVFNNNHILNNKNVKETLQKMLKYYTNGSFEITKDDLTEDQQELFEALRKWRKDKYLSEGYYHAYIVFNDKELINIITSDIKEKEDLLKVKGIGRKKYDKYADEIYEIIKNQKYNNDYQIIEDLDF